MTGEGWEKLAAEYKAACGEELPDTVPLDFGFVEIEDDQLIQIANAAIARGKPIDWSDHFDTLPEGALS